MTYSSIKTFRINILCWICFIAYELSVTYVFSGKFSSIWDYVGHYLLNIGLFYFNYLMLSKCLARKNGGALFFLVLVIELSAYNGLKYFLYYIFISTGIYARNQLPGLTMFISESIWRAIYFIAISSGVWFFNNRLEQRKRVNELEKEILLDSINKERLENSYIALENTFLKAQINPHFLYNVLGFIHNAVLKHSEPAADAVLLLSDMMRYALSPPEKDGKVYVSDEIQHIKNFISINQIRFDQQLNVRFDCVGETGAKRLAPLLLITIVENVFKYGDLWSRENPATILLKMQDNRLDFIVNNRKSTKKNLAGSGIGLSNLRKRLEQHHQDHHLVVNDQMDNYELTLSIIYK